MQAIFSAKLFRTSSRQAAIRAALEDPINQELVLQLKKYIDEDSVAELQTPQETEAETPEVQETESESEVDTETEDLDTADESSTEDATESDEDAEYASTEDGNTKVVQVSTITKTTDSKEEASEETDDTETSEEEDVSSSFAANMVNITAANSVESVSDVSSSFVVPSLDTIQGQLNSVEDTCGVVRTKQSGDELWVYFNDKKNLNNLMDSVIDRLSAAGFYQLEFNRLARTDNAIVFQIVNISSEVSNGETKKASSN